MGDHGSSKLFRLKRRDLLIGAAISFVASRCGLDLGIEDGADFDAVLDRIHTTDFEFGSGLSNHAPMAAESLVTLGRGDRVAAWVREYAHRLATLAPAAPLSPAERMAAIGDYQRRAAWIATYTADLESMTPREILAREWPALVPGLAIAWHGLLRTAHAVRSLERADTPVRRREFAHALAYWITRRGTLPGSPGAQPEAGLDVVSALARVPIVPASERVDGGLIAGRFASLANRADFVAAVERVDLDAMPVADALGELVAAAARVFVNEGHSNIALLHGITGTSALRLVLPWLDATQARTSLGYAYQSVAATLAVEGPANGALAALTAPGRSLAQLAIDAGNSNDEHTMKLTEACVRENAIATRPEWSAAAAHWSP